MGFSSPFRARACFLLTPLQGLGTLKAHGGELKVETKEGEGTELTNQFFLIM